MVGEPDPPCHELESLSDPTVPQACARPLTSVNDGESLTKPYDRDRSVIDRGEISRRSGNPQPPARERLRLQVDIETAEQLFLQVFADHERIDKGLPGERTARSGQELAPRHQTMRESRAARGVTGTARNRGDLGQRTLAVEVAFAPPQGDRFECRVEIG